MHRIILILLACVLPLDISCNAADVSVKAANGDTGQEPGFKRTETDSVDPKTGSPVKTINLTLNSAGKSVRSVEVRNLNKDSQLVAGTFWQEIQCYLGDRKLIRKGSITTENGRELLDLTEAGSASGVPVDNKIAIVRERLQGNVIEKWTRTANTPRGLAGLPAHEVVIYGANGHATWKAWNLPSAQPDKSAPDSIYEYENVADAPCHAREAQENTADSARHTANVATGTPVPIGAGPLDEGHAISGTNGTIGGGVLPPPVSP